MGAPFEQSLVSVSFAQGFQDIFVELITQTHWFPV